MVSIMNLFGFNLIDFSVKGENARHMFKPSARAKLNELALNRLFNKFGFNDVHKDIITLCSNLTLISVACKGNEYTALKLYFSNSEDKFKQVAGNFEKCDSLYNLSREQNLEILCALNLNKDATIGKKIYLETQEVDLNMVKNKQAILQDLNKDLLLALPELMKNLNFDKKKISKVNETISYMKSKEIPLATIGVDIDSNEIKLYFDYGQ
ncbi:hypothetical protein MNB_SUP05-SYMBIONT-4-1264 [hydrothermal vent metagenome]|uniref:Uncharacterized protein n=1 Tax=hydrothermal vent metagenome TaxID=652676 RepID=A0A1W1DW62_9ZZZZ